MTEAASAGSYLFEIESLDATSNLTISASATGMYTTDSEIDIAEKIASQLYTILTQNEANFDDDPTPRFLDEGWEATYRINRTDHVVSFWSQARFKIKVIDNECGNVLKIADSPCLVTVGEARAQGVYTNQSYTNSAGTVLTDDQIADLILTMSAEFISMIKNPIVAAGYIQTITGRDYLGTQLKPKPGISIDEPRSRYRDRGELVDQEQYLTNSFIWDAESNTVEYRWSNNFIRVRDPYSMGTYTLHTYVAGYMNIPSAIKRAVLQLATGVLTGQAGMVQSLQGASFRIAFFPAKDYLWNIMTPVRRYIL